MLLAFLKKMIMLLLFIFSFSFGSAVPYFLLF